jgi:hypothetical protein
MPHSYIPVFQYHKNPTNVDQWFSFLLLWGGLGLYLGLETVLMDFSWSSVTATKCWGRTSNYVSFHILFSS